MRISSPQIEIDELTALIRESMTQQKDDERPASTVPTAPGPPALKLQPDFEPRSDHHYHISDLLCFHDRTFVQAAYRAVLKRSPDETEFHRELKRLRSGELDKIDLLASLRFRPEGRAKKVQLDGLLKPALIRRLGQLPVIGYGIRLGIAFLRLPNLIRDQRQFSSHVLAQHEQITDFVNVLSTRITESHNELARLSESLSQHVKTFVGEQQALAADLERAANARFSQLDQRLDTFERNSSERLEALLAQLGKERTERQAALTQFLSEQQALLSTTRNELESKQSELNSQIARLQLQLQHSRSEITIHGEKIRALSTGDRRASPTIPQAPIDAHHLDAFYAALEDRFRGTREEIKERFQVYLPYINGSASVVDLGCGRGEWLELLNDAAIDAHGVDTNRIQVEACRTRGLNVSEEDFLVHLRGLADASVGAVTGFHIIEHVSLDVLITLVSEVMRVLRPGGVVIFETPNPENVLVGSQYFYLDPTHRHPLPSELMKFLLDSRGFDKIQILNLHPWDSAKLAGDNELTVRFNTYFYGPMDYAIVGRKVSA
jgi:O-antigen chain-terminating methyltransferase